MMHTAEAPDSQTVLMRRCSVSGLCTADRTRPHDRKVSVLWWAVPTFAFWCALVWWLS